MLITVYPERKELTTMAVEGPVISNSEPIFQSEPRDYRWAGVVVAVLGTFLLASYYLLPWIKIDFVQYTEKYKDFIEDTDLIEDEEREQRLQEIDASRDEIEEGQDSCIAKDGITGYEVTRRYSCEEDEYQERDEDDTQLRTNLEYSIALLPIIGVLLIGVGLMIVLKPVTRKVWMVVLTLSIFLTVYPTFWERAYIYALEQESLKFIYDTSSLDEFEDKHGEEARQILELRLVAQSISIESGTQLMIHTLPGLVLVVLSGAMIVLDRRRPNSALPPEEIPPMNSL
jgi:hypothetical protein